MTGDRRGFHYALEPVRSITAWKIDALALDLAASHAALDAQQRIVDALTADFAAARIKVIAQRQARALLDIDAQRMAHAYMLHLQNQLAVQGATLRTLQQECDDARDALLEARRYADSLDRDKDAAAAEHDLGVTRRSYLDSDDNWMQRQHWRKQT